ncbi:hypothetical protein FQN51_007812 [Onygenales sp. PD_10]|nr:hypothetical protein FQN51_007812 [Onygenales sp. PD_10]
MQRIRSMVHHEGREKVPQGVEQGSKFTQPKRRTDNVLAGQGSHLADKRSGWGSGTGQRYEDVPEPMATGAHKRSDSGVGVMESQTPQKGMTKQMNGPVAAPPGDLTTGTQANTARWRTSDMSPSQKQQMRGGQTGVHDEKDAAASAAASAYFGKPGAPSQAMRAGQVSSRMDQTKEGPASAWGKGREFRPLAHDPLAGIPRPDTTAIGTQAAPTAVAPKAPQMTVPPAAAAAVKPIPITTGIPKAQEMSPEGYTEMMEQRTAEDFERQHERPISAEPEIYEEAPSQPTMAQTVAAPAQPVTQPIAAPKRAAYAPPEREFVTADEIAAREAATRQAVIEEATARKKAAEEVAAREAVTREAAAREAAAREAAMEEIAKMEAVTRQAASREANARESAEAELAELQKATRAAVAKEAAARDAATASIQAKEAATREAAARETLARETMAERIAARETVTREAIAREAAAREAANREAAIKQANTREIAAEEVAIREAALREGGFDEALARDAAIREVAAEEAAALRTEGQGYLPEEHMAPEGYAREAGPEAVAAGGAFAEEVPTEEPLMAGQAPVSEAMPATATKAPTVAPTSAPAAAPVAAAAPLGEQMAEPTVGEIPTPTAAGQPTVMEQDFGAQAGEDVGARETKQRAKEEKALEKQRTKEEKTLEKQRSRDEKLTKKEQKKAAKKQEKEAKRKEKLDKRSAAAEEQQRDKGFVGLMRRASRTMGLERPGGYGIDSTLPHGTPSLP